MHTVDGPLWHHAEELSHSSVPNVVLQFMRASGHSRTSMVALVMRKKPGMSGRSSSVEPWAQSVPTGHSIQVTTSAVIDTGAGYAALGPAAIILAMRSVSMAVEALASK